MGKYSHLGCTCRTSIHHDEYDLNHQNYSCTRCCPHDCCCRHNWCRKNLCDTDFSIRLGGLQDGFNYRLRQLLWCEAEFELDNGDKIQGMVVSVGSNFVEVLIEPTLPQETEVIIEAQSEETSKVENELCNECGKRIHGKCKSRIFPSDKIANFTATSSSHYPCSCHEKS